MLWKIRVLQTKSGNFLVPLKFCVSCPCVHPQLLLVHTILILKFNCNSFFEYNMKDILHLLCHFFIITFQHEILLVGVKSGKKY